MLLLSYSFEIVSYFPNLQKEVQVSWKLKGFPT